ncbi:MAG: SDR family NAD(P)-dependent oxidoreductase [Nocardiopsaceae bacterium]|nr:SDR family NAD(P)-dependent oxidoreductase [Nocardiopsaceae bacterium]
MPYPTDRPATWFVTGTSRGLGLELVTRLLQRGDNVAATTRSVDRLLAAIGSDLDTSRLLPLPLDLGDEQAVAAAVERTIDCFGSLDAVVNNAGYGFLAAVEESSDSDVRAMFDVQIFGVWNVLRAVLPILRKQAGGHIVNVSSVLGLTAVPGWGLYCAGKFALEGLTEALAGEVAAFGIDVTIVEPGYFRTSFLTQDSLALPGGTVDAYPELREMVRNHLELQGSQLGNPAKGAEQIISRVSTGTGSPLRLLLGSDAHAYATAKVAALQENLDQTRESAPVTDFPAG